MATLIHLDLHHGLVRSRIDREADGSYRLTLRQDPPACALHADRDELQLHLTHASVKSLFVTLLLAILNETPPC